MNRPKAPADGWRGDHVVVLWPNPELVGVDPGQRWVRLAAADPPSPRAEARVPAARAAGALPGRAARLRALLAEVAAVGLVALGVVAAGWSAAAFAIEAASR